VIEDYLNTSPRDRFIRYIHFLLCNLRIPPHSDHPFRYKLTTDSAAL